VITQRIIALITILESVAIGEMAVERPRTNIILKRLEPITFPRANPLSPFFAATMLVTS